MSSKRETIDRYVILGRGLAIVGLVTCLTLGWWRTSVPRAESAAMHFADAQAPAPTSRCAECHRQEADSLATAPHSMTLQSGSSKEMLRLFDGLKFLDPVDRSITDQFTVENQHLWRRNSAFPDPLPIDWVLGSGHHARTPVTVRHTATGSTELLQHRISWYPDVGLDLTLGSSSESSPTAGWHGLGTRLNPAETAECFGCHSTWLPETGGNPDLTRIVPGVQCTRCHLGGNAHLTAMQTGSPDSRMERWADLSPLDSIRRCGECHRRDDHFTPRELRPDNKLLIRFAPVGLSQSRCFISQGDVSGQEPGHSQRLDCMTCHNPHRPAETRAEFYIARCQACHDPQSSRAIHCSARNTSQHCLECHMPKVEVQPHLRFTDHWIRKRST